MKITIVPYLILLGIVGPAHGQVFKNLNIISSKKIDLKLKNLEAAVPGIQYQIHQDSFDLKPYEVWTIPLQPGNEQRLRVVLQNVNQDRCVRLKNLLASSSIVDCEALKNTSTSIDLKAFLEPAIQAIEGSTYLNQNVLLSPGYKIVDGDITESPEHPEEVDPKGNTLTRHYVEETNCWGTAWEVARRSKENITVQVGDISMLKFMQDSKNVKMIVPPTKAKELQKQLAHVKYRDILLVTKSAKDINAVDEVLHVATFIDQNLVFEKQGNFTQFPFKISNLEQTINQYGEIGATFRIVRPLAKFPNAREVVKNWTTYFGPNEEDYEGLSSISYQGPIDFRISSKDAGFVLGERANTYSLNTIALLEAAKNKAEVLATLNSDKFIAERLTQDEISSLASEIMTPKYPNLSRKALLLRGLYFR